MRLGLASLGRGCVMLRASLSAPHDQPAVHPYKPGHFLTTSLAGGVVSLLGHRMWLGSALPPCGLAFCGANPSPGMGRESPGTLSVLRRSPCRAHGVASFDCSARVLTGCRRLVALVSCLRNLSRSLHLSLRGPRLWTTGAMSWGSTAIPKRSNRETAQCRQ